MKKFTLLISLLFGITAALHAQIIGDNWSSGQTELDELMSKVANYQILTDNTPVYAPSGINEYCGPLEFPVAVEPITLVNFAGIDNTTDPAVNGSPAHEDFTNIVGHVEKQNFYDIVLKGNTNGDHTNRFVVFIDWNHNDILDDPGEIYEIATTITNSTGTDEISATGNIAVPFESEYGPTLMRIKKVVDGAEDYLNPCIGADNGQVEDYTLNVDFIPETRLYTVSNRDQEVYNIKLNFPNYKLTSGDTPLTGEDAGAIDPANPQFAYVFDENGDFYKVDLETVTYTLLGNIPGNWVGAEFDVSTGIFYAITTTDLYIIDPVAVTAELVGSLGFTNGELPMALAINGQSVGYTFDTGNTYTIDLNTGTATILGPHYNVHSYPSGMCYVQEMDRLYAIVLYNETYQPYLTDVNQETGKFEDTLLLDVRNQNPKFGWLSSGISFPPADCTPPEFVAVNYAFDITSISWIDYNYWRATGYDWELYLAGDDPATTQPVQSGHTGFFEWVVEIEGLEQGYNYDFYVSTDCGANGISEPSTRVSFQTNLHIPPNCASEYPFTDRGGRNGDYWYNQNQPYVMYPENEGEAVMVTFSDFDIDPSDALYVYDGSNEFAPLIDSGNPETESGFPAGGYYGTEIPGPFVSTHPSGRLYFVFRSDGEYTGRGWEAEVSCLELRPVNDLIENAFNLNEEENPYKDPQNILQYATEEAGNPSGCDISEKRGVWYKFTPEQDVSVNAAVANVAGETLITFYTAPNENATESDLIFVDQPTNHCEDSNSSSIIATAGQTYYVFAVNTGGPTDVLIETTPLMGVSDNAIEGFTYHPNPTTGKLSFKGKDKIDTVVIFNLSGQKIWQETVNATSGQIDLSKFPAGVYLMQVETNGQRGAYKIIKK